MLRPFAPALAALAFLASPASAQSSTQSPSPTADQILAGHFEARGGMARLRAIQTLRISARAGTAEYPVVTELKRPMHYRQAFSVQGMSLIEAYDGKSGWTINPFSGYGGFKEPQPLNPEQLRNMELDADLDGPLMDWQAKGHKVELLGKEDVDGSPAWKLRLVLKNGDQITYFLDMDTCLEIKEITKRIIRGSEVESESVLGNYEESGGVMFPRLFENGPRGSERRNKVTVDKVEINVPISDDRFAQPATQPAAKPATR